MSQLNSVTMRLQILLILVLQVALVESLMEVSEYLGHCVTLPSGANSSWNLSTIEWSIFSNNTWIATFRNGKENVDRVNQYKGRLSLNTSSGDLMICNLTKKDAMEYTLDLINTKREFSVNKIKLIVRQRIQKPTIETFNYTSINRGCWMELNCSSVDTDVELSWQVKPPSVTSFNMSNHGGNSALLLVFLNTTQDPVEFTCTSSRNMENVSYVVTRQCPNDKTQLQPQPPSQPRCRNVGFFIGGLVLGLLIAVPIYLRKEHIKAAWDFFMGNTAGKKSEESKS